jgi:hypothetical protein
MLQTFEVQIIFVNKQHSKKSKFGINQFFPVSYVFRSRSAIFREKS